MENSNTPSGNMEANANQTSSFSGSLTNVTTNSLTTPAQELSAAALEQVKGMFRPELKEEVNDIKKDFITIFGLFASFVTFLSIEVQVFKNSTNILSLIGVSAISLAFIMVFTLLVHNIVNGRLGWGDMLSPIYVIVLALLFVGTFLLVKSDQFSSKSKPKEEAVQIVPSIQDTKTYIEDSAAVTPDAAGPKAILPRKLKVIKRQQ